MVDVALTQASGPQIQRIQTKLVQLLMDRPDPFPISEVETELRQAAGGQRLTLAAIWQVGCSAKNARALHA